jgi:hypothetical protein
VPRRWVRYQLPVMVCVEISDTEEHEHITKVVLGTEPDDLQLARDLDGHELVYDEHMERVGVDEPSSRQAFATAADHTQWPTRPTGRKAPTPTATRGCTTTATSTKTRTRTRPSARPAARRGRVDVVQEPGAG